MTRPTTEMMTQIVQLVVIVGAIVAGTISIQDALHKVDMRLVALETKVDDRWRGSHMILWAESLKDMNPDLTVPNPAQIMIRENERLQDIQRQLDRYKTIR